MKYSEGVGYPELAPNGFQDGGEPFWIMSEGANAQTMALAIFAQAIAEFEGFYIPETDPRYPAKAQRNNNPGNLRPVGASTGFRTFATAQDGWNALARQIAINIGRELTLREFFLGKPGVYPGYAPLGDNDASIMENYIGFVARRLNIADNVNLAHLFPDIAGIESITRFGHFRVWTYKPFWA